MGNIPIYIISIKKHILQTNSCHYCHKKMGILLITVFFFFFFNPSNSLNNNYRREKKNNDKNNIARNKNKNKKI